MTPPSVGQRFVRGERGMALVFVGVGLMALVSVSVLAIDVGMLMTARAQAQNAADAGAFAGGLSLVFDDYDDRSTSGPAVQSALTAARANSVMGAQPAITAGDVVFSADGLQVTVYRTAGRANPLLTLMARYVGLDSVDVTATATSAVAMANAETCMKPFTVPDRWTERQTPPWDPTDTFDMYDNHGVLLADPDIYVPASQPGYTGYDAQRDKGLLLTLKGGNGNSISPSIYQALALSGSTGADDFRWNIANCHTAVIPFGAPLVPENGNMVGPTQEGVDLLVATDPGAYWDTANDRVSSTKSPSARVVVIPLFDPAFFATGKQQGRNADLKVANFLGFFIVGQQGNDVLGRVTPIAGLLQSGLGDAPAGAFPKVVRLTQ